MVILFRIFIFLFAVFPFNIWAKEENFVKQVENYLNSFQSLQAKFTQIMPDGNSSEGIFYLFKPGKIRWEYNNPSHIVIYINKSDIIYNDLDLDEVSYTTEENIANFLSSRNIKLQDNFIVKNGHILNGMLEITLFPKNNKYDHILQLFFTKHPFSLKKMNIIDIDNQSISIVFENMQHNIKLNPSLFKFQAPSIFDKIKNRR